MEISDTLIGILQQMDRLIQILKQAGIWLLLTHDTEKHLRQEKRQHTLHWITGHGGQRKASMCLLDAMQVSFRLMIHLQLPCRQWSELRFRDSPSFATHTTDQIG